MLGCRRPPSWGDHISRDPSRRHQLGLAWVLSVFLSIRIDATLPTRPPPRPLSEYSQESRCHRPTSLMTPPLSTGPAPLDRPRLLPMARSLPRL